jgi:hypothetical protein
MARKIYNTPEEQHAAKKRHALATYYRKVARDEIFINQKKDIRSILSDKILVDKLHKYLVTIQGGEQPQPSEVI